MKNQRDENGYCHGPWEEAHSNSQPHYKGEYKNGNFHGLWEFYYSDGQLVSKGKYKNNQRRALWYESKYN